ncbi:MAG: hypothetical protein NTZ69_18975 [Bacteroidia bacterium]|nr:hypothetical protein [Bacteroidia bacterium]
MINQSSFKRELYSLSVSQFVSFIFFTLALIPVFTEYKGEKGIGFYTKNLDTSMVFVVVWGIACINGFRIFLSSLEVEENPAYCNLVLKNENAFKRVDWWIRVLWLILVLLIPVVLVLHSGKNVEWLLIALFFSLTIWNSLVLTKLHRKINSSPISFFNLFMSSISFDNKHDINLAKQVWKRELSEILDDTNLSELRKDAEYELKELLIFRNKVRVWFIEEFISLIVSIIYLCVSYYSSDLASWFPFALGGIALIYSLAFIADLIFIDFKSYVLRTFVCAIIALVIFGLFYTR